MLEADYRNTSQDTGTNGTCWYDSSKVIGRVGSWGTITGYDGITMTKINEVKQKAVEQPLSISIDASTRTF